ncbi:MAG: ogr/Delta-like zinc finger family protein [Ewingella sp.]|uniref:ogr/Delta-like zinc finger family protein n=1 Tax=Ewingella TaxID=41201 RepID=UPI0033656258
MMHCPICSHVAHTRTSRYLSESTKERHHQCQNKECECRFVTLESLARIICKRGNKHQVARATGGTSEVKV